MNSPRTSTKRKNSLNNNGIITSSLKSPRKSTYNVNSSYNRDSSNSLNLASINSKQRNMSKSKKKKMVIKPFKLQPKLPENFEEETWGRLHRAILSIQQRDQQQNCSFSLQQLYQAVEDLCSWKMAPKLYERLEETCTEHITSVLGKLVDSVLDYNDFLELIDKIWADHCQQMLTIRNVFLYLDRTYVIQNSSISSIWEMGLAKFQINLFKHPQVEAKLINGLLMLIERERCGEAVNRSVLYNLFKMLSALRSYTSKFETSFLASSKAFYTAEGINRMGTLDVGQFLLQVDKRLHEENDRVSAYLNNCTRKPLIAIVEGKLLKPHVSNVIEKGFDQLLDGDKMEDLKRMYSLFFKVNGIDQLKEAWKQYIRRKGSEIVMNKDPNEEKMLVQNLLTLKMKLDSILSESFHQNSDFVLNLKAAMEYAVNVRENRPAELVAKFVDNKLRSGSKGISEQENEEILDQVIFLFRYIQGKDVFEAFYTKDLAKRLLLGKSASFDLEKSMLMKLKTECGSSFTTKLEGMFKDVELSKTIMSHFQQHSPSRTAMRKLGEMDMNVHVLTTTYWPVYVANKSLVIPKKLLDYQGIFESFYTTKHQGRRLQWQHSLGHCMIKAFFPKGNKDLSVSLFQALVLLCFNHISSDQKIPFCTLKERTGIEDGELRRTLQSLACGKVRVLQKVPKGREILDNDSFVWNESFTNQLCRIKINSIQMKETKEENKTTNERVFRDRQYQVDAAIVRIMKARKQLSHTLLMAEIYAQLRFPAKPQDIKRRIESLIDREYLARDDSNSQTYNYLA